MPELAKPRRWKLDHGGQVVPEDGGPAGTFTAQEWRAQQWPPCPVCGADVEPQRVDIRTYSDKVAVFALGPWECPNDCDPRHVLRHGPA